MKSANFASNLRGRLVRGSLYFHTPCVFVMIRHISRLTALFKMCTTVMVVTYFRVVPNGVQFCFNVHIPLDPSWRSQFVAWSNHFFSCSLINPLFSRNSMVVGLKCFLVAPLSLLYVACVVASVLAVCNLATSEYSAKLKESSLASATFFTGDVNPILAMAQTLPTTNPSEFVGG